MAVTMDVPESQRLIAVSLGKIAASRGQKGGINLHKNLLVATVLNKARAAYMIQHITAAKQRAASPVPLSSSPSSSSSCVEMKEQKPEPSPSATSTATSSPSVAALPPSPSAHSPVSLPAAPQSVTPSQPQAESPAFPEGAAGTCSMQVVEADTSEDKENTPPPPSPSRDATTPTLSPDCEKRLQGEGEGVRDTKGALSSRPASSDPQQQPPKRDHVSKSSSCCLLKRRRAMDRDHENVSAPKVRIVEARVGSSDTPTTTPTSTPEPMQCDSPQISNLVNIFNTSFSGLSGASSSSSGGDVTVISMGQSLLSSVSSSSSSHKLSENLTCAKEMKVGGLDSVHQPLVLSV